MQQGRALGAAGGRPRGLPHGASVPVSRLALFPGSMGYTCERCKIVKSFRSEAPGRDEGELVEIPSTVRLALRGFWMPASHYSIAPVEYPLRARRVTKLALKRSRITL